MAMDADSSIGWTPGPSVECQVRRVVSRLVIAVATVQLLGITLKVPTLQSVNDISRWCTVWALLERGTYAIDECPWKDRTIDKVYRVGSTRAGSQEDEPVKHFYSSKPALLSTVIATLLYPFRAVSGVPLDQEFKGANYDWPICILYFKPIIVAFNVLPYVIFLTLYVRLLDRYAANDMAWYFCLFSAAWGTPFFAFNEVLNNHTIASYSAFFSLYAALKIWNEGARSGNWFALAGFFGASCACNELPAALFGILLFGILVVQFPRLTALYFVPAAAVPCVVYLATEYLAHGSIVPIYAEFGTASYRFEGSYWNNPSGLDALHEWKIEYLYHLLIGHHGIFSLTPIFLFSMIGALGLLRRTHPLSILARLSMVLSVSMVAFYTWRTNNYGGTTAGLRWSFWLSPFWLILLPVGMEPVQQDRFQRWVATAALLLSVLSVGYAIPNPWTHPWLLDLMVHLGEYEPGE